MVFPIISVLVPVYNVEDYLRRCLDSILSQTFTNFEAVLVDDGSTDNSGVICDEYAAKHPNIVVIHKNNEGVAKARITAFEHSKGQLITFVDSDDYIAYNYLERLSKPIFDEDADIVSCDFFKIENKKTKEHRSMLSGTWGQNQIDDFIANHFFYDKYTKGYGMSIFLWTKMVKRHLVMDGLIQGKGMWYAEDQIAVFHMIKQSKKIVLISDRLYYYVQHEGQTMTKYNYSLWDNLLILMERYKHLDINNVSEEGRRKRTWLHIHLTIFMKMAKADLPRKTFVEHVSKMRSQPYMMDFFRPMSIDFDFEENFVYLLLKFKQFSIVYYIMRAKSQLLS